MSERGAINRSLPRAARSEVFHTIVADDVCSIAADAASFVWPVAVRCDIYNSTALYYCDLVFGATASTSDAEKSSCVRLSLRRRVRTHHSTATGIPSFVLPVAVRCDIYKQYYLFRLYCIIYHFYLVCLVLQQYPHVMLREYTTRGGWSSNCQHLR